MTKRVLIEAEKTTRPRMQGTQRYVRNLIRALAEMDLAPDCELFVLIGGNIRPLAQLDLSQAWTQSRSRRSGWRQGLRQVLVSMESFPGVAGARRSFGRRRISARARQRWASAQSFDLVHMTSPHSYRSLSGLKSKLLGSVLDLTHRRVPESHLKRTIDGTEEGLCFIAKRAAGAIAISESTRRDFLEHYEFRSDRIRVVPLGVDHRRFSAREDSEAEAAMRAKYGISRSFVLGLSTLEPRKNVEGLLRAWARLRAERSDLDADLVVAGGVGWKAEDILGGLRAGGESGVLTVGFVDDEDLPVLLRAATCFCYISHYEGFGLPLLEAMCCGTPVIYGNNSSMPEVVGCAGLGVASHDSDEIAAALKELLENAPLRREMSRLAVAQAALFSWERTARETLEFYRELW